MTDSPVRVHDALASGVAPNAIAVRPLRVFWGIVGTDGALDARTRCQQLMPRMAPDAFFSHTTAALLRGIPVPHRFETDLGLHVTTPRGHRAPHAEAIIGHQMTIHPDDVSEVGGLPVSAPHRIWRELAGMLSMSDLVAAGDAMIHHSAPMATVADLSTATRRSPSFRGQANAMRALSLLSDRAESPKESTLRVALILAGLPEMAVNENVYDARGEFVARLDLRFRGYPVAAEYDGRQHGDDVRQWQRDVSRLGALDDIGIAVVRATAGDLPDFIRVIRRCQAKLRHAGWRPQH